MLQIITLLCMLLSLYQSNASAVSDQLPLQEVYTQVQILSTQVSVDTIQDHLPSLLSEVELGQLEPVESSAKSLVEVVDEQLVDAAVGPLVEMTDEPLSDPAAQALCGESPAVGIKNLDYKTELKKLGFYKEESKDVQLNLRNAILRFQSSCNLTVNGNWDDKCLSSIAIMLKTGSMVCEDLIEAPPADGKWITINKTKRILTLYENRRVLHKYPIAIGNPPSLTPNGKFTVVSKVINPSWGGGGYAKPVKGGVPENPLGYRWLGISYKDGSRLGMHGNNSPYSIGKNVSHGCVRMINSDVEQFFSVVPRSAPVWIGTEEKLKEWGVTQNEYSAIIEEAK